MPPVRPTRKPTAVDLFAGAGGLSLGLRRAGFRVTAAVEIDSSAADTYEANHPGVKLLRSDIREVTGREISPGSVDLVAGCAPCQGFCSLTRKVRREDPRNELVLEMGRIILELKPKIVLMENVPGLLTSGEKYFRRFVDLLERAGYVLTWDIVQMANFGVPQNRRRMVLTGGQGFHVPLPEPTHSRLGALRGRRLWRTVGDVIRRRSAPTTISMATKNGGPRGAKWHVVRDLKPQTKVRLKAAVPGRTWLEVDQSIRPNCHRNGYKGFMNTYGRMTWDQISPTVTGGCTTPCKGRFGHPDRRRTTISVREAALLQTFPGRYDFVTESIDNACDMIGNAVPPLFAEALGQSLMQALAARTKRRRT